MTPVLLLIGLLGAAVGSFLNVVIHRMPLGESLIRPRSRCPECQAQLRPLDNVPVVSWLALRGRCRGCGARISSRYPLVELGTAAAFVGVALARGVDSGLVLELPFAAVLVAVAAIDLEHRIVPNRIVVPAAVFALAASALLHADDLPKLLIAGAAAFGGLLVAALAYPGGMGMGDVKLAGVMGLYLGAAVAPALLAAFAVGAVAGLAIMAREGAEARKRAVPFAPFLAVGGMLGLIAGPELVELYQDRFLG
jgi:leader peptidase (prepilin peptidase)/N-methyltransferase